MVERIQIAHIPDNLPLYIACFKDVKNASFLKQQLLAGNQEYNYSFIDASTILSRQHLLAAAFRALTDHVHDQNTSLVQSLNHMSRRHTNSRDEQLRLLLNHNADKLVQLPVGVVMVCFPRRATNLRQSEIHTERKIRT